MHLGTPETRTVGGDWHSALVPGELVFPEFDEAVHVLETRPSFPEPDASTSTRYVSYQTGFSTPFVAMWYHHDLENDVLYSIQEWRAYRQTQEFAAAKVLELTKSLWHSDTAPIVFVTNEPTTPFNGKLPGLITRRVDIQYCIDTVRQRLIDKKLFFYREQLVTERGQEQEQGSLDEWVSYKYCTPKNFEKRPLRKNDSGLQTLYQVLMAQRGMQYHGESPTVLERRINSGFHRS